MKEYKVYKHPTLGMEAIKKGFSWPALLLGVIWMFSKKLWGIAALWVVLFILLGVVAAFTAEASSTFTSLIMAGGNLILLLLPGFKGNEWLMKKFNERGFTYIDSIKAASPEAAIGQYLKDA